MPPSRVWESEGLGTVANFEVSEAKLPGAVHSPDPGLTIGNGDDVRGTRGTGHEAHVACCEGADDMRAWEVFKFESLGGKGMRVRIRSRKTSRAIKVVPLWASFFLVEPRRRHQPPGEGVSSAPSQHVAKQRYQCCAPVQRLLQWPVVCGGSPE